MEFLGELFTNKLFLAPAAGWFFAQVIKVIVDSCRCGFNVERLYGCGGMPSSHAATVTGLALITGLFYGPESFEFVLSLFLAIIVIYDARGVRFETQRQGRALNNLNEERQEEGKQPLDIIRFKEKMGHTMPELLVGMLIGIVCGVVVYYLPF